MKPIIFSTEMVQKILSGDKSQTRRVVKIPSWTWDKFDDLKHVNGRLLANSRKTRAMSLINPPYAVGDVLWVRETYCNNGRYPMHGIGGSCYKADCRNGEDYCEDYSEENHDDCRTRKWKPAIHMPKDAARIFLRVTGVRAERLQDVTESDAQCEGVYPLIIGDLPDNLEESHVAAFSVLWEELNADRGYGWDKNPWVWVIEFERCEKPSA